jgi:uncharacterized protein (TIGR02217 family)
MGVSFDEVQFPASISQGAVGGMRFSTTIIALSSGSEHRNINWGNSRGKWDVKHGLKTQTQIEQLIDFFAARFGRAYGFRFKDWIDYRVPRWEYAPGDLFPIPVMFTTDGTTKTFQIVKMYGDTTRVYARNVTKPVAGTTHVMLDGVEMPSSGGRWSVDTTTGIITILDSTIWSRPSTGNPGAPHQLGVATEFDVPARFDVDEMQATITTTEIYSWDSIPVVEIREIT